MTILPIHTFDNPILWKEAEYVETFDDELSQLAEDLTETMNNAPSGVGLAAPQIGVHKQICVFDIGKSDGAQTLVNPEIVEKSDEQETNYEGCLSIPGWSCPVTRHSFVRVKGVDVHGQPVEYAGRGLISRVLQHEVDHLNGLLLTDRLPLPLRMKR